MRVLLPRLASAADVCYFEFCENEKRKNRLFRPR
jgi:hypothetical protein